MEISPRYHASGSCPYCGSHFEADVWHEMELTECDKCARRFVRHAIISVEVRTLRIEGETLRQNPAAAYGGAG